MTLSPYFPVHFILHSSTLKELISATDRPTVIYASFVIHLNWRTAEQRAFLGLGGGGGGDGDEGRSLGGIASS